MHQHLLRLLSYIAPLAALAAVYVLFVLIGPASFRTADTAQTILVQSLIVAAAALGMTLIMIAGGIDLSVGSVVALVTVVIAAALRAGASPVVAVAAGVAVGAAAGLINGILIVTLRVGSFIVTLGTLLLFRGLAEFLADSQKIDAPAAWLPMLTQPLGPEHAWMLVPPGLWLVAALAIVVAVILWLTVPGRQITAVGSNETAARFSGIRIGRVRVLVYTLGGALFGFAGAIQFSRLTVGDPTVATGLELEVIAAVVIGGASLSGGSGSVIGSLAGTLLLFVISTGCDQMGLPSWVQRVVTGAIIVGAVTLDRLRRGLRG